MSYDVFNVEGDDGRKKTSGVKILAMTHYSLGSIVKLARKPEPGSQVVRILNLDKYAETGVTRTARSSLGHILPRTNSGQSIARHS
jgi:hypothetical protein